MIEYNIDTANNSPQDIYLARAEGELQLEEELFTALIKVIDIQKNIILYNEIFDQL